MEHGFPVSRILPLLVLLFAFSNSALSGFADPKLVLVAHAQSPISRLSSVEARKLYLGVPHQVNGRMITPLRNTSDARLQEAFMQRVMYMATETYERQILNRVFRLGGERPRIYTELRELMDALNGNPFAVSYIWRDTALATPGLKIVGDE